MYISSKKRYNYGVYVCIYVQSSNIVIIMHTVYIHALSHPFVSMPASALQL